MLHRIYNSEYKEKFKDPFVLKALRYWSKAKPKCDPFMYRSMKRKVKRLLDLRIEIADLETEMEILLEGNYTLQTMSGCGTVIAGMIVGGLVILVVFILLEH